MPKKNTKVRSRKEKLLFEFRRKFVHAFALLSIPIYYFFFTLVGKQITLLGFLFVLLFFIVLEYFRIYEGKRFPIINLLWREKEGSGLGGQVYFMIGIIIAFSIFDFRIAMTAILMTTFGDMAAALFGIAFGKHKVIGNKTWEGTSAEFVVNLLIGILIIKSWTIAIPMALTATIVEVVFPHVDDNLAIPTFSGFIGQCLQIIVR